LKEYILIVEDEAVLYRRMKKILSKEAFEVGPYTPSVEKALELIHKQKPDLVLLDIKLQGDLTGIDLGKMLYEKYKIPFIYVTDFDNDMFFSKALETHHEQYLVKTKPSVNANELKRAIYTVLQRYNQSKEQKVSENKPDKTAINALVDYLDSLKTTAQNSLTKKTVLFEDIAFFTTDIKHLVHHKNGNLRKNYIWFVTQKGDIYFLKKTLKALYPDLPDYFVRVSDNYIINLLPKLFNGKINNNTISVNGEIIKVSNSYKKEFLEKFKRYYYE